MNIGSVETSSLGYGISLGRYIVLDLPYVSANRKYNEGIWWGDIGATVAYAKRAVPAVLAEYGGNSSQVLLSGFSRGAIAVSFIGLYDDEIAKLWTAFFPHVHMDGMIEWVGQYWGSPFEWYRQAAISRLSRLKGRPLLTCQNIDLTWNLTFPMQYLPKPYDWTLLHIDIYDIFGPVPNSVIVHTHTDKWFLVCGNCSAGQQFQTWLNRALNLR